MENYIKNDKSALFTKGFFNELYFVDIVVEKKKTSISPVGQIHQR